MALCCAAKSINHQCLQLFLVAMSTFLAIASRSKTIGCRSSRKALGILSVRNSHRLRLSSDRITDPHFDNNRPSTRTGCDSALNGRNAHVLMSIVLTNKKYNGSTLEIQGTSRQFEQVREVSVVSGTGKFRFARGYVTIETYSVASNYESAVVRYDIVTVQQK